MVFPALCFSNGWKGRGVYSCGISGALRFISVMCVRIPITPALLQLPFCISPIVRVSKHFYFYHNEAPPSPKPEQQNPRIKSELLDNEKDLGTLLTSFARKNLPVISNPWCNVP